MNSSSFLSELARKCNRNLLKHYRELLQEVDAAVQAFTGLQLHHLHCREGCCSCCALSSVLPLEAAALHEAISQLAEQRPPLGKGAGLEEGRCSLLADSRCTIYRERPFICRTHGLPLAYVDYERQAIEVSACPVNFPADYEFDHEGLFFIDPFTARLAQCNIEFCRQQGITDGGRIAIADIVRAAAVFSGEK